MGLEDFWPAVLPHVKRGCRVSLSEFRDKWVGVDISSWIYTICLANKEIVFCYASHRRYLSTALLDEIKRRHVILGDFGITPVYVFDGNRHKMKSVAREKRNDTLQKAREGLSELYDRSKRGETITVADRQAGYKFMKDSFEPDQELVSLVVEWMKEEAIEYFNAPFEAEWQLVEFENQNIIQGVICVDSDFVILGAKRLLVDTSFNKRSPSCYVYDRSPDLMGGNFDLRPYTNLLPEFAAFYGCDYIKRVKGNGVKTIMEKRLPEYVEASRSSESKRQVFLESIDESNPNYATRFNLGATLFKTYRTKTLYEFTFKMSMV
jgi:5'-3' exonuclease